MNNKELAIIHLNAMGDPVPTKEERIAECQEIALRHNIIVEFIGSDGVKFVAEPKQNNSSILVDTQ